MAILLGVCAYESIGIVSFFNNYVANGYQTSTLTGLSTLYTPAFMYILVLGIVILVGAMLFLMIHKDKPRNLYIFIFIYYLVFFFALFYLSSVLRSFETELLASTASRRIRDILLIGYIPQIVFVIMIAVRAIGFDIKKFNFSSDLSELDLSAQDAEEFEVNINFEGYKAKRDIHRIKREFGYYIRENKFVVRVIIGLIVVGSGIAFIASRHSNYDRNYRMGREIIFNKLSFTFEDAMITNMDFKGNKIDDNYYVVVKTHVVNNTGATVSIDYDDIKLQVRDINLNPTMNLSGNFVDFVSTSPSQTFAHRADRTFALVYKITKGQLNSNKRLVIYNGTVLDKGKNIDSHSYIPLKTKKFIDEEDKGTYKIGELVSFSDTLLEKTTIVVNQFDEPGTSYKYKYKKCATKNDCKYYNDLVVIPINSKYKDLLILKVDYAEDLTTIYGKSYKKLSDFSDFFAKIRYHVNDEWLEKSQSITPQNVDNFMAFAVDSDIAKADSIQLVITIRNYKYYVTLK